MTVADLQVATGIHVWPCRRDVTFNPPLVLIHGWGSDSAIWAEVRESLTLKRDLIALDLPGFGDNNESCPSWEALLHKLGDRLPPRCDLMGWSLGGMVATALAARWPERVNKLITIAGNARFVAGDGWPHGMPQRTFDGFSRFFAADSDACLRQFAGLQARGDGQERMLLKALRQRVSPPSTPERRQCWQRALAWLGEIDNRDALASLSMPSFHLFGETDTLVPAACGAEITRLNAGARVQVLAGVAHVPQLSVPDRLVAAVDSFLAGEDPYHLEKRRIADSFSRAAARYDQSARLQRDVGEHLLTLIDDAICPDLVMDLGAGTGLFTRRLRGRYPKARVLGVDLAEGMMRHAGAGETGCDWLCGDAEALPLATGQMDLVFSNFAFQWCQNLPVLATELHRVLAPGGSLVFSTVGPRSLWQLREAWAQVDDRAHVNRFDDGDAWRDQLLAAGFVINRIESRERSRYYPALSALTAELKGLGAHNLNGGRPRSLTPRRHIAALKAAYERYRTPDGLPASWEVITVVAQRPPAEEIA